MEISIDVEQEMVEWTLTIVQRYIWFLAWIELILWIMSWHEVLFYLYQSHSILLYDNITLIIQCILETLPSSKLKFNQMHSCMRWLSLNTCIFSNWLDKKYFLRIFTNFIRKFTQLMAQITIFASNCKWGRYYLI